MKYKILLSLVIVFGILFRVYKISSHPFPPNGDELAFGYYGWSLLNFGTDEYGNNWPISFISIGDLKYPALAYANMLPALFFGLSEITTRFWSVIAGIILIPLIYKLALLFYKDKVATLSSTLMITIMPWAIIESRLGYENLPAAALLTGGFYLLLRLAQNKDFTISKYWRRLTLILLAFLFSIFLYAAARIFIPAFLVCLILISFVKGGLIKNIRKALIAILVTTTIVIIFSIKSPSLLGRSSEELWKGPSGDELNRLEELYVGAGKSPIKIPPRLTWLFHNKYKIAIVDFLDRYTEHFSFKYLFFEAEASLERLPEMGVLSYYDLIFLPIGLLFLIQKSQPQTILIIFTWLMISPLASSLTFGGAHINRASMMIVPLSLISGYGLSNILTFVKISKIRIPVIATIFLGLLYLTGYMLNQLFIQKPLDKPWYKEQVYKEVANEILEKQVKYDAVAIGDDDYIFFLFYGKISPVSFIQNSEITPFSLEKNRWERVNRYKNIYFKMPFNCPKGGKLNVLYVCSGDEIPQNVKVVKAFYYLDHVPAYALIEFYPLSQMPKNREEPPPGFKYMVDVETSILYPDGIIPSDFESLW